MATEFPDAMDDPRVITAQTRVNADLLQSLDDQIQGLGRGVVGLTGKQWRSLCDAVGMAAQMDVLGARLNLDLAREGDRFL